MHRHETTGIAMKSHMKSMVWFSARRSGKAGAIICERRSIYGLRVQQTQHEVLKEPAEESEVYLEESQADSEVEVQMW